jgi:hypothetical protein
VELGPVVLTHLIGKNSEADQFASEQMLIRRYSHRNSEIHTGEKEAAF